MPVVIIVCLAAVLLVVPGSTGAARAADRFVISAGEYGGVYYALASSLCRLVNRAAGYADPTCFVRQSTGSIANLEALRSGEVAFAIAQADVIDGAMSGETPFKEAADWADLRSVLAAHDEMLTLVVKHHQRHGSLDDLRGRRVAVGATGSGALFTTERLLEALRWPPAAFTGFEPLSLSHQVRAFCTNHVDAAIFHTGHPNGFLQELTIMCDGVLAQVAGPAISGLIVAHPTYQVGVIPGSLYPGNPRSVTTLRTRTLVVSRVGEPDVRIERLLTAALSNSSVVRAAHPALSQLEPEAMVPRESGAPLHPAAKRSFQDHGLVPEGGAAANH